MRAAAAIASEAVAYQVFDLLLNSILILILWNLLIWFVELGAKLPLYAFKKESSNVVEKNSVAIDEKKELQPDFLDSLLIGEV